MDGAAPWATHFRSLNHLFYFLTRARWSSLVGLANEIRVGRLDQPVSEVNVKLQKESSLKIIPFPDTQESITIIVRIDRNKLRFIDRLLRWNST